MRNLHILPGAVLLQLRRGSDQFDGLVHAVPGKDLVLRRNRAGSEHEPESEGSLQDNS